MDGKKKYEQKKIKRILEKEIYKEFMGIMREVDISEFRSLKRAWKKRKRVEHPGLTPKQPPVLDYSTIPYISAYIKKSEDYKNEVFVVDPSKEWRRPIIWFLEECRQYIIEFGNDVNPNEIEDDIATMNKVIKPVPHDRIVQEEDVFPLFSVNFLSLPIKAKETAEVEFLKWRKAMQQYMLSKAQHEGGIVRFFKGIPYAPMIDNDGKFCIEIIHPNDDGVFDIRKGTILSHWGF